MYGKKCGLGNRCLSWKCGHPLSVQNELTKFIPIYKNYILKVKRLELNISGHKVSEKYYISTCVVYGTPFCATLLDNKKGMKNTLEAALPPLLLLHTSCFPSKF